MLLARFQCGVQLRRRLLARLSDLLDRNHSTRIEVPKKLLALTIMLILGACSSNPETARPIAIQKKSPGSFAFIPSSKRKPLKIQLQKSSELIAVTKVPRKKQLRAASRSRHIGRTQAGACIFPSHNPTSTNNSNSGISVCKYLVSGDADASDSVSFQDGDTIKSIQVVPIFFGTSWLTSNPSSDDVMSSLNEMLSSPYLTRLGQYGFVSLNVRTPVLVMEDNPSSQHTSDEAGQIVWDLIDSNVFPEPDEPGGHNAYIVFFPTGTAVSDLDACGWHSLYSDFDFPADLDWAWVGAVDFPSGANADKTLHNIVRVFSHELVEILTDPEANVGWQMDRVLNGGTEIGDACNSSVDFLKGTLGAAYKLLDRLHRR